MNHLELPQDLTAEDAARLGRQIANLKNNHGGNGFAGIWSPAKGRAFLAVVAEGELAGWVLAPAASEAQALKTASALAAFIGTAAVQAGDEAAALAAEAIRKSMH